MTKTMATELKKLVDAGFSIEDAVAIVAVLHDGIDTPQPKAEKATTTKAQPKAEKATTTKAQPKAESKAKAKAQPKAESKAKAKAQPKAEAPKTTAKAVKPNYDHGFEVMADSQFKVVKTTRTDDPTITIWRVSIVDRVSKPDFKDLAAYFGREFDAGYWRGAWSFAFDPSGVLNGEELTEAQAKAIADAKSARKARKAQKSA